MVQRKRRKKHRTHVIRSGDHVVVVLENGDHVHIGMASGFAVESRQHLLTDFSYTGERVLRPHKLEFQLTIKTEKLL